MADVEDIHFFTFSSFSISFFILIWNTFSKSFACPKIKSDLKTGTSIGDLSPEDITIIASMGDALAVRLVLPHQVSFSFLFWISQIQARDPPLAVGFVC